MSTCLRNELLITLIVEKCFYKALDHLNIKEIRKRRGNWEISSISIILVGSTKHAYYTTTIPSCFKVTWNEHNSVESPLNNLDS